jgi:midasin
VQVLLTSVLKECGVLQVLLDELNLASQSVLEGLNACLDHRKELFLPELGRTFSCPPTFRIFAAQNPLHQGGGRKGLPRSFLNRFTSVRVEELDAEDLLLIAHSAFPDMPEALLARMIAFNMAVHAATAHEFASNGRPWEFNLRDIFRWCELMRTYQVRPSFTIFHLCLTSALFDHRLV